MVRSLSPVSDVDQFDFDQDESGSGAVTLMARRIRLAGRNGPLLFQVLEILINSPGESPTGCAKRSSPACSGYLGEDGSELLLG